MLTRRQAQLLHQQQAEGQKAQPQHEHAVNTHAEGTALVRHEGETVTPPVPEKATPSPAKQEPLDESANPQRPRRLAASRLLSSLLNTAPRHTLPVPAPSTPHQHLSVTTTDLRGAFAEEARGPPQPPQHHSRLSLRHAVPWGEVHTSCPSPFPDARTQVPSTSVRAQPDYARRRLSIRLVHEDNAVFAPPAPHSDVNSSAQQDRLAVKKEPRERDEEESQPQPMAVAAPRIGRPPRTDRVALPPQSSRRLQLTLRASAQQRMRHGLWTSTMAEEAQRWHACARGYHSDTLELDLDDDDSDDNEDRHGENDSASPRAARPPRAAPLFFANQKPPPLPATHGTHARPVDTHALMGSWRAVVEDLTTDKAQAVRHRVIVKRRALTAHQEDMADSVHRQYYLRLHEERMRLLLSCAGEEEDAAAIAAAGTAAASSSLVPGSHAAPALETSGEPDDQATDRATRDGKQHERESAALDILAALDAELQTQFASVYRLALPPTERTRAARAPPPPPPQPSLPADVADSATDVSREPVSAPRDAAAAENGDAEVIKEERRTENDEEEEAWWIRLRLAALGEAVEEATHLIPAFRDVLMPYQKEGVRWMLQLNAMEQLNGILADDMGLGKTAQTVMYLTSYKLLVENVVQRRLERLLRDAYEAAPEAYALQLTTDSAHHHQGSEQTNDSSCDPALSEKAREEQTRQRARLHRLVRETRLAKELKRWVWQLSEADVVRRNTPPSHNSSMSATYAALANAAYPETQSPATLYMRKLLALPRYSSHLNALLEVCDDDAEVEKEEEEAWIDDVSNQAVLRRPLPLGPNSKSDGDRGYPPRERWHEHMGRHCMRPILILAPLSTLPHWAAEFAHFGVDHLFSLYLMNGPREERSQRAKQFLRHVRGLTPMEPRRSHKRRRPLLPEEREALRRQWRAGATARAARRREDEEKEDADPFHAPHFGRTPVLLAAHDFLARPQPGNYLRQLPHVKFHVVVIDEAQRIKNKAAELFRRVCRLHSTSRLILTGTPLQNNIKELFALLQFIAPESFHTRRQADLLDQLDDILGYTSRSSATEYAHLRMLLCRRVHRLLTPFILRRDKSVLKTVLPAKKDFLVVCPLLPRQVEELVEVDTKAEAGTLTGNPHVHVRKILLHPYTRLPYFYVDDDITATSGKVLVLDFMMSFLRATGHKFLVFCSWTLVLDVVESLCQYRALPYVRLDGNTSAEMRETNIQRFNATNKKAEGEEDDGDDDGDDPELDETLEREVEADDEEDEAPPPLKTSHKKKVDANNAVPSPTFPQKKPKTDSDEEPCCFLISKVAGGVGLNLQSADTVFLLDVDYNPQRDLQALSRVYRVGQKREVRIFRLVVDHPVERNILEVHRAKENLDQAVVQAGKFDLHSSSDDRQAELNKLFGIATTTEAQNGRGIAEAAASAGDTTAVGSPVSPNAPLGLHLPHASQPRSTNAPDEPHEDAASLAEPFVRRTSHRRRRAAEALTVHALTPAEHLVDMADTFREILPRSEAEGDVLDEMLHDLSRMQSARRGSHA